MVIGNVLIIAFAMRISVYSYVVVFSFQKYSQWLTSCCGDTYHHSHELLCCHGCLLISCGIFI